MLCFAEEIYLLALDEKSGKVLPDIQEPVLGTVLIGAVLTELTFQKKISTDEENVYILDDKPAKSPILNEIWNIFRNSKQKKASIERVLQALMPHSSRLEELVLEQLMQKGILKEVDKKILWIFPDKRYPLIDDKEIVDVETRIRKLLMGNDKPDPKDAALVSLLHASDLFSKILCPSELERCEKRIRELSKMSDIGQIVDKLVYKIRDFYAYPPFV